MPTALEAKEHRRASNNGFGGYLEKQDRNWTSRIIKEADGIRWYRPGIQTNSTLFENNVEVYNQLFAGFAVRYIAVGDCTLTISEHQFDFKDGDIIAVAADNHRAELAVQIDKAVVCGLVSSGVVPKWTVGLSASPAVTRGRQ